MRYFAEKYSGRVYCGNAICETFDECLEFADDGFCDKVKIRDTQENKMMVIKIQNEQ